MAQSTIIFPKMEDQKDNSWISKDGKSFHSNDWENYEKHLQTAAGQSTITFPKIEDQKDNSCISKDSEYSHTNDWENDEKHLQTAAGQSTITFPKIEDQKDDSCISKDSESSHSNDWENYEKHLQTAAGEGPYTSDLHERLFSSTKRFQPYHDFRKHYTLLPKPLVCYVCLESFSSPELLMEHELNHTAPFVCWVCSRKFSEGKHLKKHISVHPSDKPYACKECNKDFPFLWKLKAHLKYHSKQKPYVCASCNKGYAAMNALKMHCDLHMCGGAFSEGRLRPIRPKEPLNAHPESPKKVQSSRRKRAVKANFWDTLRKGFSKSYLKDRREAMDKN